MSPTAEQAFRELVALKQVTEVTGTVTTRTQSLILRKLNAEDLVAVALAFREINEDSRRGLGALAGGAL